MTDCEIDLFDNPDLTHEELDLAAEDLFLALDREEILEERAKRAKLERFAQLLSKVPDVEPIESDRF
jgi:hypothetical protein